MFDPADFLTLADNFANGNEADRRTALSRTYYSVFLQARESLAKRGLIRPRYNGEDHRTVMTALRDEDLTVGMMADQLRRMRGQADYNLTANLTATQAINAISLARTIWARL